MSSFAFAFFCSGSCFCGPLLPLFCEWTRPQCACYAFTHNLEFPSFLARVNFGVNVLVFGARRSVFVWVPRSTAAPHGHTCVCVHACWPPRSASAAGARTRSRLFPGGRCSKVGGGTSSCLQFAFPRVWMGTDTRVWAYRPCGAHSGEALAHLRSRFLSFSLQSVRILHGFCT